MSTSSDQIKDHEKRLTFLEHLGELRTRVIRSLVYIAVGAAFGGIFWQQIFDILRAPAGEITLNYFGPLEPFMAKFKVALYTGIFFAAPFILYEIVAFIAPALTRKEKRFAIPIVISFVVLFYLGGLFGYTFVMPPGTQWLIDQGGDVMTGTMNVSIYLAYAFIFLIGVGVSFETPVVLTILAKLGVVSPRSLLKNWRYALLIILLVASILTPDWNPITMLMFAAPMVVLYFLSIILIRVLP